MASTTGSGSGSVGGSAVNDNTATQPASAEEGTPAVSEVSASAPASAGDEEEQVSDAEAEAASDEEKGSGEEEEASDAEEGSDDESEVAASASASAEVEEIEDDIIGVAQVLTNLSVAGGFAQAPSSSSTGGANVQAELANTQNPLPAGVQASSSTSAEGPSAQDEVADAEMPDPEVAQAPSASSSSSSGGAQDGAMGNPGQPVVPAAGGLPHGGRRVIDFGPGPSVDVATLPPLEGSYTATPDPIDPTRNTFNVRLRLPTRCAGLIVEVEEPQNTALTSISVPLASSGLQPLGAHFLAAVINPSNTGKGRGAKKSGGPAPKGEGGYGKGGGGGQGGTAKVGTLKVGTPKGDTAKGSTTKGGTAKGESGNGGRGVRGGGGPRRRSGLGGGPDAVLESADQGDGVEQQGPSAAATSSINPTTTAGERSNPVLSTAAATNGSTGVEAAHDLMDLDEADSSTQNPLPPTTPAGTAPPTAGPPPTGFINTPQTTPRQASTGGKGKRGTKRKSAAVETPTSTNGNNTGGAPAKKRVRSSLSGCATVASEIATQAPVTPMQPEAPGPSFSESLGNMTREEALARTNAHFDAMGGSSRARRTKRAEKRAAGEKDVSDDSDSDF